MIRAVRLTAHSWGEDGPEAGDWLRTSTGRHYLIRDVRPGRSPGRYRLSCETGPELAPEPGDVVFEWTWAPRKRRM